jgi:hypothetical protein
MRYFSLIKDRIDTKPFLEEMSKNNHIWHNLRASLAQHGLYGALDISLIDWTKPHTPADRDKHEVEKTEHYAHFPILTTFIEHFAEEMESDMARFMIVSIRPGSDVYPHIEKGAYYRAIDRYHLIIQSTGSEMTTGDETVLLKTGELWWFNSQAIHSAKNVGTVPRIHIIFDLKPRNRKPWHEFPTAPVGLPVEGRLVSPSYTPVALPH